MTEANDDSERRKKNDEIMTRLKDSKEALSKAKRLVDEESYQDGLAKYIASLNGEVGYASEFILNEAIKTLLEKFPNSRTALTTKRDELEYALESKPYHSRALEEEWMELNLALGDHYREVELLEKLAENNENDKHTSTIVKILQINFSKYLRDKRYGAIESHVALLGKFFFGFNTIFVSSKLFPKPLYDEHNPEFQRERKRITTEGRHLFELCLALNHKDAARNIAQKVLFASCSPDSFYRLLLAANRVEDRQAYDDLIAEATDRLPYTEMQKLKDALKTLN